MQVLSLLASRVLSVIVALFVKAGVPAFTAPQPEEAMISLRKRAGELGVISFQLFFS